MANSGESDARQAVASDDRPNGIDWLAVDDPRVIAAVRTAARLQRIVDEAAHDLPFGVQPTDFERLFDAIARTP